MGQSLVPRCYRCGMQGYRMMTPSMAALVPGGCEEVDASLCAPASPPPGIQPSGGTPLPGTGSPPLHWTDGPTRIEVSVLEPYELKPYPGGAEILIEQFKYATVGAWQFTEVARGRTDASGKFSWDGMAPLPTRDYRFRVTLLSPVLGPPQTFQVPARDATSQASGNHQVSVSKVEIAACPAGSDPFVCAVAESQLSWKSVYEQQLRAWHYNVLPETPHIPTNEATIAARTAAFNVVLRHPTLVKYQFPFSWWVGDREIPPKDWPELVVNYEQTMAVFAGIPFPQYTGIEDYFAKCCSGVPLTEDRFGNNRAIIDPRLYSKTWSAYFPRDSASIERDMAIRYHVALQSIFACVSDLIQQKIRRTQKTVRLMSILSLGLTVAFMPLMIAAGPGGIAAFTTTTYDLIVSANLGQEAVGTGYTAALAGALIAAGDPTFVTAALDPIIKGLMEGMDPLTAEAVKLAYPKIIETAVKTVAGPAGIGATGLNSISAIQSIGALAFTMAVRTLATIPMLTAKDALKDLETAMIGAQMAVDDIKSIINHEEVSPELRDWLKWVVDKIGLEELVQSAIDEFLDQFQQALEEGAAQGGGVGVVPEQGGGAAVVPTNADGVPVDADGNPLPGGVAPASPIEPPGPSTTTAVLGVGGAVALLLAVTGVL